MSNYSAHCFHHGNDGSTFQRRVAALSVDWLIAKEGKKRFELSFDRKKGRKFVVARLFLLYKIIKSTFLSCDDDVSRGFDSRHEKRKRK